MLIGGITIDPPVILAPMAGITDSPCRFIARQLGCPAVVTEMVSAEGIRRKGGGSLSLLLFDPTQHPIIVQLFGTEPETMAEVASYCESLGFDGIDINMGCPVRKVVKNGAGAALMRDPSLAVRIVEAVRKAVRLPVMVKLRAGWSPAETNVVELSRNLWHSGVDAVTVHPRTRSQFFSGKADWNQIRQTVDNIDIPVIGNGDILTPEDAIEMMRLTACSGVMVGRASLGNPWLLGNIARSISTTIRVNGDVHKRVNPEEMFRVFCIHLQKMIEFVGSERAAVLRMRKHLVWYTRGIKGCAGLRRKIATMLEADHMRQALESLLFQQSENNRD